MAIQYTKKKEEIPDNTFNAVEYVDRMFNQQANQDQETEEPRIESTK